MTYEPTKAISVERDPEDHLAEPADAPAPYLKDMDAHAVRREIAWLQKEVVELRTVVEEMQREKAYASVVEVERHPLLRVAATAAVSFVLGRIAQRLRLGMAGTAAVPYLATQLNRRLW